MGINWKRIQAGGEPYLPTMPEGLSSAPPPDLGKNIRRRNLPTGYKSGITKSFSLENASVGEV
jgi:hypothetical protein